MQLGTCCCVPYLMQAGLLNPPRQHIAHSWLFGTVKRCELHVCSLDCLLLVQVSKKELLAVQTSKVTLNRLLARVRRLTEVSMTSCMPHMVLWTCTISKCCIDG